MTVFKTYLEEASDDCFDEFMALPVKSITKTLLFSTLLGSLAVDRFYVGDKDIGLAKLVFRIFSCFFVSIALLGPLLMYAGAIWCAGDIYITFNMARQINVEMLFSFLKKHSEKKMQTQSYSN